MVTNKNSGSKPETVVKNGRLYIKHQDGALQLVPFGYDDAKASKVNSTK